MKLDIVLFPKGSTSGIVAFEVELTNEDPDTVTYVATFEKAMLNQAPPELPGQVTVEQAIAEMEPDTSASPEDIDYDELPDLPA